MKELLAAMEGAESYLYELNYLMGPVASVTLHTYGKRGLALEPKRYKISAIEWYAIRNGENVGA